MWDRIRINTLFSQTRLLDFLTSPHRVHTSSPGFSHSSLWHSWTTTKVLEGEEWESRGTASSLPTYSFTTGPVYSVTYIHCPNISLPMVPPHSLDPGATGPPQHSLLCFLPCMFPVSVVPVLPLPKVVTSQIQPTFSLILLRVGDQNRKQNSGETLTQRHAHTHRPSCRAKNTWKVGVLETHSVFQLQLSTWQDNSCGSSWSSAFYSPLAARSSTCWKLLQLQSPIGGHPTCVQGNKFRKGVINHRNTLLSSIKKIPR